MQEKKGNAPNQGFMGRSRVQGKSVEKDLNKQWVASVKEGGIS